MNKVLTLKHWQVFLILSITNISLTIEGLPEITTILSWLELFVILLWPLTLGYGLTTYLPDNIKLNNRLFIINGFIVIATLSIIFILNQETSYSGSGLEALPVIYLAFALLYIFAFPAKVLKSNELGRKAKFSEYAGNFLLILFWPLGIWLIQPRINKVVKNFYASGASLERSETCD